MRRIVNGPEMKTLDRYTIDRMGVPSCVLMERAALAVVDEMIRSKKSGSYASAEAETTAETVLPLPGSCTFMDMLQKSI